MLTWHVTINDILNRDTLRKQQLENKNQISLPESNDINYNPPPPKKKQQQQGKISLDES